MSKFIQSLEKNNFFAMKVLFVCIGNTCRSPMAESIMKQKVCERNLDWVVDSAGLRAWNVGIKPENRCLQVLGENGLSSNHLGRMISASDFYEFDYILGMDESNLEEINAMRAKIVETNKNVPIAKIQLLGTYIRRLEDEIIRDPYFCKDVSAFRHVFLQIFESCGNFIEQHSK